MSENEERKCPTESVGTCPKSGRPRFLKKLKPLLMGALIPALVLVAFVVGWWSGGTHVAEASNMGSTASTYTGSEFVRVQSYRRNDIGLEIWANRRDKTLFMLAVKSENLLKTSYEAMIQIYGPDGKPALYDGELS